MTIVFDLAKKDDRFRVLQLVRRKRLNKYSSCDFQYLRSGRWIYSCNEYEFEGGVKNESFAYDLTLERTHTLLELFEKPLPPDYLYNDGENDYCQDLMMTSDDISTTDE